MGRGSTSWNIFRCVICVLITLVLVIYIGLAKSRKNQPDTDEDWIPVSTDIVPSKHEKFMVSHNNNKSDGNFSHKFIFLNSYMRSGSSFLGRILGHRDDTFYFYEPLHKLWIHDYTKGSQLCQFKTPTCRKSGASLKKALMYISDIFNCKLQNHTNKIRRGLHTNKLQGPKWKPFEECKSKGFESRECVYWVEQQCMPTKFRVVKVLRMSLEDAALMLINHPNLMIVHLFRDPRGIINSHLNTEWFPLKENNIEALINDVKAHCQRIEDDITVGETLEQRFPDRVKIVQYEDLYDDEDKAKTLYKFLHMDVLKSENVLDKAFSSNSYNSTEPNFLAGAFKYRTSLPFKTVKLIDENCQKVITMLGLKTYATEKQLLDKTFNPVNGRLAFEI